MSDFVDSMMRKAREIGRAHVEERALKVARQVQAEMGDEARGVTFRFDPANDVELHHCDTLGNFSINGPSPAKDRFGERFRERWGK